MRKVTATGPPVRAARATASTRAFQAESAP
jgi:hypothetical protein